LASSSPGWRSPPDQLRASCGLKRRALLARSWLAVTRGRIWLRSAGGGAGHRAASVTPQRPRGPGAYLDLTPVNVPRIERPRHALMSVHAYVEQRNPGLRAMFANVKPWRLDEAAKEIAADPERFAPRRRRRIAVRLLAHARQEPDAVAAVEVLLGRAAEKILAQLARAGPFD